jgi:hypothetical protein
MKQLRVLLEEVLDESLVTFKRSEESFVQWIRHIVEG